jgi:hypothetical protein
METSKIEEVCLSGGIGSAMDRSYETSPRTISSTGEMDGFVSVYPEGKYAVEIS